MDNIDFNKISNFAEKMGDVKKSILEIEGEDKENIIECNLNEIYNIGFKNGIDKIKEEIEYEYNKEKDSNKIIEKNIENMNMNELLNNIQKIERLITIDLEYNDFDIKTKVIKEIYNVYKQIIKLEEEF